MKAKLGKLLILAVAIILTAGLLTVSTAVRASSQAYTYKTVQIGNSGGFVDDIIFHPKQKDLIYAKTDVGGAYRWDPTTSMWVQLFNFVDADHWSWTGIDGLAIDPSNVNLVYAAGGSYVNSWDPLNGVIWRSSDQGKTWAFTQMPFKIGGNMNGRGMGERLAVDPNKGSILYFGARDGNGLWKSTDSGVTWAKVTNFPDTGPFVANATDPNGYLNHAVGVVWVTFDPKTGTAGNPTQTIYVGVADNNANANNIYRSTDGGATWAAIPGEPTCNGTWGGTVTCSDGATWTAGAQNSYTGGGLGYLPHSGKLDSNGTLYVTYSDWEGPFNGGHGAVYKYVPSTNTWTNITPCTAANNYCTYGSIYYGFGGLGVDLENPGTIVVTGVNSWWPDAVMFRTTNGGTSWNPIWTYASYPNTNRYYQLDLSAAPWYNYGVTTSTPPAVPLSFGWMMEGVNIDPFNPNRLMYGTGGGVFATTNLTAWDTLGTVTFSIFGMGMNETAVLGLISPPAGGPAHLISAVGDDGGWIHTNLDAAPTTAILAPCSGCNHNAIDFAEKNPQDMVTVGTGDTTKTPPTTGNGWTTNGGTTWFSGSSDPIPGSGGGTVAMAADGSSTVWAGSTAPVSYTTTNGSSWTSSANIPAGSVVASDRVNAKKFYGLGGGKFWVSTDGGATFTASAATGLPSSGYIKAVFGHEGDIWIAGRAPITSTGTVCASGTVCGLWHSTDSGATFTQLSNVANADVIGFGMAAPGGSGYPAIFMAGTIGGVHSIYRSDDAGATWIQITDSAHNFSSVQAITGDPQIYGRVYIGSLGIIYGDIAGTLATNTPGPSPTPAKTNTPTPTNTTGPTPTAGSTTTPTATKSASNTPTFVPPSSTPITSGSLTVGIDKGGGTDNTQETTFNFVVKNTGTSATSGISTRIYFNTDGSNAGSSYVLEKYYDQSSVATISGPTLACGSTYYFTVSYGTASLGAGAQWEFQTALHLSSWASTYDGSNDFYHTGYAVGALPAAYTNTNYIPGYANGTLSWGSTPNCGGTTNTPIPTTAPTKTNTPIPTTGPSATPVPPTKTNTPAPTSTTGPTATTGPTKTSTSVPTATTVPTKTNTPAVTATPNASDPCASPTVITGGGTFSVTTASTCFKYVNTSFVNGGMFSVMKDGTSTSDTIKWYGGMDQNATSCTNQSATISGNGGQLNNFTVAKDANGQMFLIITGGASNSVTISIQNWQNGSGCSIKPTVHP